MLLTANDPAPMFEPKEFRHHPLRQPAQFWNEPLSERLSEAFTATIRAGATQLERSRSDADDGTDDFDLTPANWQRLLAILQKSPVWSQWSFSRHRMRWIHFLSFFDDTNIGSALQLLLRPSSAYAACSCLHDRVSAVHRQRKAERARIRSLTAAGLAEAAVRLHRNRRFDTGDRMHSTACRDGHAIQVVSNAVHPLCSFFLRPDAGSMVKSDSVWSAKYYGKKLAEPNGIGRIGRAVAAAHLFAIFFWRGVSTTTALIAGDVVLGWPGRPAEKIIRTFFAAVARLPVPRQPSASSSSSSSSSSADVLLSKDPESSATVRHLRQLHEDLQTGSTVRYSAADLQALADVYRLATLFMRDTVVV
jgi:hypothetical protein